MTIQIDYEAERKLDIDYEKLASKVAAHILETEHCPYDVCVNLVITDNEEIKRVNTEFRSIGAPTDVLSFPLGENGIFDKNEDTGAYMLGDIVISVEKATAQAELYGHSFQREMGFLTVHSMLHLLGYDHEAGGLEAAKMREKEEMILARLGLMRDTDDLETVTGK